MNSIKQKGGKRRGAGRPPKKVTELKRLSAAQALEAIDETKSWRECLTAKDLRIRLDALKYLTDRRDGKAPQSVDMTSGGQPLAAPVLNITFVDADSVSS